MATQVCDRWDCDEEGIWSLREEDECGTDWVYYRCDKHQTDLDKGGE